MERSRMVNQTFQLWWNERLFKKNFMKVDYNTFKEKMSKMSYSETTNKKPLVE